MAVSPKIAVRVEEDLLAWLDGYAIQRHTSRSAVVNAALRELKGLATGGMPDLELEVPRADGRSAARQGKVPASGGPSSPGSASPAVPRPAAGDAPELQSLEEAVILLEQQRFGSHPLGREALRLGVRRRIRLGRVLVAGEVLRDPAALVDPSEVSV